MSKIFFKISSAIIILALFICISNNWIQVSKYNVRVKGLPSEFKGYKIVHLSDIHNKLFGKKQSYLVNRVKNENPDIIAITGDLIDRRKYNKEIALILLEELVNIAPVYYVTGNHEWWSGKYDALKTEIESKGVHVLSDKKIEIPKNNEIMNIIGLDDPAKYYQEYSDVNKGYSVFSEKINLLVEDIKNEHVTILLSHRPELFDDIYVNKKIDLVLSGHTHGGQVRLPFIGGVVAPNQGLLPNYDGGSYKLNHVTMIVNRGLGNSIVPIRVFNRPEVGSITLSKFE